MTKNKERKPRGYVSVNVPKDRETYLEEALEFPEIQKELELANRDRKASSLGVWIIDRWLIENTSFRFEHFNTYEDHATIKDKKAPERLIDIYPKEDGALWCEHCESTDCEHVKYALTIPEIVEPLKKRGWKYKE